MSRYELLDREIASGQVGVRYAVPAWVCEIRGVSLRSPVPPDPPGTINAKKVLWYTVLLVLRAEYIVYGVLSLAYALVVAWGG